MGAAQTRKLPKKLDQNFHTLVQCEHNAFNGRAHKTIINNSSLTESFLKDGGSGEEKLFFKKVFFPRNKKQKNKKTKKQKPQITKISDKK